MLDIKSTVCIMIFIVILYVSHHYIKYKLNESFIPSFTMITDQKPDVLKVSYPYTVDTDDIKRLLRNIKNLTYSNTTDNDLLKAYEDAVITDAFTLYNNRKLRETFKFLSGTNSDKCAYFIRLLDASNKTFNDENLVIGCVSDIDAMLMKVIFSSFRANYQRNYTIKQILIDEKQKVIDSSLFTENNIDVLFVYESLESKVITKRLDPNMKIEVWDYADNLDIHRLKVQIPYIKKKNVDFSLYFSQLKGKLDIVSSVFVVDVIIVINEDITTKKNVNVELNNIISYYNKPEIINLYEQYFSLSMNAVKFAKGKNDFYMKRDTMQILEQFKNDNENDKANSTKEFTYHITDNVNGFFNSLEKSFYVYSDKINNIPLMKGDLLQLSGQLREEQNGLYRVLSVSNKQSILLKLDGDNKQIQSTSSEIGYSCDNPSIKSKTACESSYDELGNTKGVKNYWDKPCEAHTDCPFYQANKNYKNYRGGCIDGRCELPVGVKAVSYRLYDKTSTDSKPVCYNCNEDVGSPFCCEEQEDRKKYPKLSGPDYAFELDSFERLYTKTL